MSDVEVVIVLGKGVLPDGTLPSTVRHQLDYALSLHKPVLVSGNYWGLLPAPVAVTEASVMAQYANQPVLMETQAKDTIGNLLLAKQIIDQHGWQTIQIVTSAEHLSRVQLIAERVFHSGYHLQYHGHDHVMTVRAYLHTRRYEWCAKLMDRWILRKLPAHVPEPMQWLEQHHFMYSDNGLSHLLRAVINRPKHR